MTSRDRAPAGAEFAELIQAATLASIARTEARSPAAAEYARRNLEDITQAAALEALERISSGAATGMDPAQLASRSSNAAIRRAWYQASRDAARTTPDTISTADGDEIHPADLDRTWDRSRRPEEAAEAADMLEYIISIIPAAYRQDAPRVLRWTAAGYTAAEIARETGSSSRRVQRILKAARDAAREIED
jgi:hypothetical protein